MNKSCFKRFGIMLDCSRNAIMQVSQVKKMMDYMFAMGYNTVMLYIEDTYEVDNQPYFGYLRGRYSQKELKEIDSYANEKGMEFIPCIQTLAHLNALMHWPQYIDMRDCEDILCAGDEKVYELIKDIFASLDKVLTSRTINIGMDEAYLMGRGRYMDINGACDRTEILINHLKRVADIAARYDFTLLMWSDMFFRLATGTHYGEGELNPEIRNMIPENVRLVYWDYNKNEKGHFDSLIKRHKAISDDIWFAGGAQSWHGFTPHNTYAIKANETAVKSCTENGIENYFVTVWGDDGGECSRYSVLPTLFAVSEFAKGNFDKENIKEKFKEIFKLDFDKFMLLELPDTPNSVGYVNPDKYMLYSDPFLGVWDATVCDGDAQAYKKCAEKLAQIPKNYKYSYIFESQHALCELLSLKFSLGVDTRRAYLSGEKEELLKLLPQYDLILTELNEFYTAFEKQWMLENKPHGFDVQDIRLGGLEKRVRHCKQRLEQYIEGTIKSIEELEEPLMHPHGKGCDYNSAPVYKNSWKETSTANVI